MAKMCVRELRTEDPSVSVFYLAFVSAIAATIGCSLPATWVTPPPGMSLLGFMMPRNLTEGAMLVGVGAQEPIDPSALCMNARHILRSQPSAAGYARCIRVSQRSFDGSCLLLNVCSVC